MAGMTQPRLCPTLVVDGAEAAIAYYTRALGAKEVNRFADDDGTIVHAEVAIGDAIVMLKDPGQGDEAPGQVGGTPVILSLEVDDVDAVAERMVAAGGTVVYPVADQPYGKRAGRVRDPYGHLWILSQPLDDLRR